MDQELLGQFLEEAIDLFEDVPGKLLSLELEGSDLVILNDIFRAFHTIKGGAGFLSIRSLVDLCHRCEDIFDQIRSGVRSFSAEYMDVFSEVVDEINNYFERLQAGDYDLPYPKLLIERLDKLLLGDVKKPDSPAHEDVDELEALFDSIKAGTYLDDVNKPVESVVESSKSPVAPSTLVKKEQAQVRVDTSKIDIIMNLVGELVLNRNRLKTISAGLSDETLNRGVSVLDFITSELQSAVMSTRMQPVKKVFQRFPKLVRDISRSLNKEVTVELIGQETELDKNLVDALSDPLVHMVRNSVDHGIELPEDRIKAGKPREGIIKLSAQQLGDSIEICVSDDGKGIDPEFMRKKGVEKGIISEAEALEMTDDEALQIVFLPGFSTASSVTNISGRGVGMDVVKTTIRSLNGTISIESKVGVGSTIKLQIPLTMAILQTLLVESASQCFALPLSIASEIFFCKDCNFNVISGRSHVQIRGRSIPSYRLHELLPSNQKVITRSEHEQVIIVKVGEQYVSLIVDTVIGQEEVVIKPMGSYLKDVVGYSGATITGDGNVALILDISKLVM